VDFATVIIVALGLAMDAFAVSIASGVIIRRNRLKKALLFGCMFGGFQMLMPVLGWAAGYGFRSFIAEIDHWIAFALLFIIGSKMIYEAAKFDRIKLSGTDMTVMVLLGLSMATSIDALAVGISFAFLEVNIFMPVLVIGIITFVLSFAGILIGSSYGARFEKKIEVLGGIVLIGMGFKILLDHLF